MSQVGMHTSEDVMNWCSTNDAVCDVDFPKPVQKQEKIHPSKVVEKEEKPSPKEIIKTESPVEVNSEKKQKILKRDENDSQSGSE